jgi:DNA-binding MarR family transcriptional regulator
MPKVTRKRRRGAPLQIIYGPEESIGYQLRKTSRKMAGLLKAQLENEEITIAMWYFLRALWERDGVIQRTLAEEVGLMQPTTVTALHNLQNRGLVRTERDKVDRRSIRIYLTAKGRRLKAKLLPKVATINEAVSRGVNRKEFQLCLRILTTIHENAAAVLADK